MDRAIYGRLVAHVPALLLLVMIGAYAFGAGGLALRRHWNLESQALDMGYADQITWNMLHGRWFRFTVFRGTVGSELGEALPYGPRADRDSLFAYHVELIYLPLALLYLVHAGPETLIVLLTAVLALGAVPVYWIARRALGSRGAALAFSAMYLAFPSIQAANLTDFHPVSMAGPLLLLALHLLLSGRIRAFAATAVVCAALKEEVGLFVGALGLYAWLALGRRRLGAAVAAAGFAWSALCFGVVIPYFTDGAPSLFLVRYGDALQRLRDYPRHVLGGEPLTLLPDYAVRYVAHLLSSSGFLAVFGPGQLALAAPAFVINGLSLSTWQHGGGAHYSSEAVPGVLFGAIAGTRWLAHQGCRRLGWRPQRVAAAAAAAGLAIALVETRAQGILPPATRFQWPEPSERAAHLRPLLALIPARAAVSAQSNVYPHLSTREKIYVFPTIDDAEYVLIDVAGTPDPLSPDDHYAATVAALHSEGAELLAAADGFLLVRRHAAAGSMPTMGALPEAFYSFVRPSPGERYTAAHGTFEGLIDVVGYRLELPPGVNFSKRHVRPVIYFRARRPLDRAFRLTPFLAGRDNVARISDDGNAAQLWHPTLRWLPGEVIRVRYPPLAYGTGDRLGIGIQVGVEADAPRLRVASPAGTILDEGRVLLLGPLP